MTFKVKNGIQIGSALVFDSVGNIVSDIGVGTAVAKPAGYSRFIAIGDSDTGIGQRGDGVLSLASNNVERMTINGPSILFPMGSSEVQLAPGPQTNSGYVYGNSDEIGLYSGTSTGQIGLSKLSATRYINLNSGSKTAGNINLYSLAVSQYGNGTDVRTYINNENSAATVNKRTGLQFNGTDTGGTIKEAITLLAYPANNDYITGNLQILCRYNDSMYERLRIEGNGNISIFNNFYLENSRAIYMKDSGGTSRTVLNIGSDNYVNIYNGGNVGVRILNQAGSAELFRVGTAGEVMVGANPGDAGQSLISAGAGSAAYWGYAGLTAATPVSPTGVASVTFTGIPSNVNMVVISVYAVSSTSATGGDLKLTIGPVAGVETSGYINADSTQAYATGTYGRIGYMRASAAGYTTSNIVMIHTGGNKWTMSVSSSNDSATTGWYNGIILKTIAGALERLTITMPAGNFDAGTINIAYA